MWEHVLFGSGTQIVTRHDKALPHYYIYGPVIDVHDEVRFQMANDLTLWLNGKIQWPVWLANFERVNEEKMIAPDGSTIIATGPLYDSKPPACCWKTKMDKYSIDARARLIDDIWFVILKNV